MKRVVNSYSVSRTASGIGYRGSANTGAMSWLSQIPNYMWLAMIVLSITALLASTLFRTQVQKVEAKANLNNTRTQVENAVYANRVIRDETNRIKKDPGMAADAAQKQLRLFRSNEIVVTVK